MRRRGCAVRLQPIPAHLSLSVAAGAGAMRSTARDLALWMQALLDGEVVTPRKLGADAWNRPVSMMAVLASQSRPAPGKSG